MNKLNVAVTGASGYIGSRILAHLVGQGHHVASLGRKRVPGAEVFVPFTLGETNKEISFRGVDVLIHCAYDFRPIGYAAIAAINRDGSIELFKQAQAQGVKKIIFISTTSAFDGALSDYGRVKFEIERWALAHNILVVRPGLVFSRDAGGIVGALNRFVQKFPFAPVIGNGQQKFYPCHVDDLCDFLVFLAANDIHAGGPIVAANEKPVTFREILHVLADIYGKKILLIPVSYACLFMALRIAEILGLPTGLRSDSLKYMKQVNPDMDFSFVRDHGVFFRTFNIDSLR